ncbi:helix-turn-helix transcriptional regulator [Marinihelvus fidelis]|uniref:Helix-turn-helix transcriptional regulator n=1 Tax=Marinihelvus fidelis TaxID=2613842 RepID=A0A5N0T8J7_9GAMM|nr:helix-turn-helix transcriptional regulator [Marinihelvus fidelis]KAA9131353.1 helix-turn-helix transcriptional regulator [Marinihelvus fidelis]
MPNYTTASITTALRNARKARGLSQRALGELTGVPQSHISRIEQGNVDLRVSSLVELARTLGLELALVPREALPAISAMTQSTATHDPRYRPGTMEARPAYSLDDDDTGDGD